jgi:hypothetical protein
LPGREAQSVQSHSQDARVGFGETAAFRGDHYLEEWLQASRLEPRALDAVDTVGHDSQPVVGSEAPESAPTAGQAVAALGKMIEVDPTQAVRPPSVCPQEVEQAPEALHCQGRLGDLAAPVGCPELFVDAAVLAQGGAGQGQAQAGEGGPERRPLRAVEIEQSVVEVEENGAKAGQGGYLAR